MVYALLVGGSNESCRQNSTRDIRCDKSSAFIGRRYIDHSCVRVSVARGPSGMATLPWITGMCSTAPRTRRAGLDI